MDRREFLAGAAATTALLATRRGVAQAAERDRPNLILIFADDIGIGDIHCYGADHYQTPNLDALAAGGTRFETCCSTPLCGPSRCQTLSGRYPFRTHMTSNGTGALVKPANEVFLPTVLKAAGYATASIGKWSQLPLQPGDFGFDEYLRFTGSGKYWPTQEKTYVLNGENKPLHDGQYVPDVMHDFLVDFVARHHDQPFYAHYPMSHCHGPIQRTPDTLADAPRERLYADNIAYMDKLVGRLVAALGKLGLRERTLLLFTGDNGTQPGQAANATIGGRRLSGQKGTMLEGGVRVPLIANQPGMVPAGKVNGDLIDFSDFLPTFAELAGAKLPDKVTIDGHSFAPQLRGETGTPREWVYVELNGKHYVRTKRWKLTGTGELYDMKGAPFEELLVAEGAQDAEAKAAREHLQQVLRDLRAGAAPTPVTPAKPRRRGGANRRRRRRG